MSSPTIIARLREHRDTTQQWAPEEIESDMFEEMGRDMQVAADLLESQAQFVLNLQSQMDALSKQMGLLHERMGILMEASGVDEEASDA
jgi:uncharacterized protein YozE (UPF0346 family)